jgi:thymidylate synthase (FAD)
MEKKVTILTIDPTIEVIAEMKLVGNGIRGMARWVNEHRPECMPDDWDGVDIHDLFPHRDMLSGRDGVVASDNELLVELAGRKCYDSFGLKAGRKTNAEYIANTQSGEIPHASILYHAKMSFFFAGISRRVSHEIIRNYVGADRDEEGAPSQESTRFTHHYGFFIAPIRYVHQMRTDNLMLRHFTEAMQAAYNNYLRAVEMDVARFVDVAGEEPKGIDKKRIYEAASSFLPHQAETSFIWTTNPAAIAKLCRERCDNASDLEIQRFAKKLRRVSVERWPNLFPQPWMQP